MGRNAQKELARIVATIAAYVDAAAGDPTRSLSYDAIERATGVSRGHLSRRKEPEILALVERIATLRAERLAAARGGEALPAVDVAPIQARLAATTALDALSTEALGKMLQRELRDITRLQQQWIARHGRAEVHEAALAVYDADELLRRLRSAVERLRGPQAEWTRRHGVASGIGSEGEGTGLPPALQSDAFDSE